MAQAHLTQAHLEEASRTIAREPAGVSTPEDVELVPQLLASAAEAFPQRAAVVCDGEILSYAELLERARRLACGLLSLGLGRGAPVAILLPNGPAFVTAFFAVAEIGAVAVPLNPHFKEPELEFCFRDAGVRGVVADAPRARSARRVLARIDEAVPVVATGGAARNAISADSLIDAHAPRPVQASEPDDPCVFQYSSGSTGRSKRVPRTHRQLAAEATSLVRAMRLREADSILSAIPLSHSYGMGCCLTAGIGAGARLLILGGGEPFALKRRRALELVDQGEATVLPGVPLQFRLLAETRSSADLSGLRLCLSAAASLPLSTFHAFKRRFGVPLRQLYGTTETGTLTVNMDDDPDVTASSVGRPIDRVQVVILNSVGAPLETGRIGEIAAHGPGMTSGYACAEEVNRRSFHDGFFLTGDRGRLDEQGRLFITGRKKLLIDVKGDKVDPIEVEDVLATHPRVQDVVVVGVRSDVEGEQLIKAVVVPTGRRDERELLRFCRERLANYKVPNVVEFRDEIPKSSAGRVLRKYLVE